MFLYSRECLWSGPYDRCPRSRRESRMLELELEEASEAVDTLRIELDQTENWYYSEIDAVKLVGFTAKKPESEGSGEVAAAASMTTVYTKGPYCHMDGLPEEIVVRIMEDSSLCGAANLSATSKRYRDIFLRSSLLKYLDLKPFWSRVNPEKLASLSKTIHDNGLSLRHVANSTRLGLLSIYILNISPRKLDLSWCGMYHGMAWVDELDKLINVRKLNPIVIAPPIITTSIGPCHHV